MEWDCNGEQTVATVAIRTDQSALDIGYRRNISAKAIVILVDSISLELIVLKPSKNRAVDDLFTPVLVDHIKY